MQVYKFGGASIADPERMQALLPIIQDATQPIILVASAIGKTTNALEAIVAAACKGKKQEAHDLVHVLEQQHLNYAKQLLNDKYNAEAVKELNVCFTELQWAIDDATEDKYDYSYDQIVCMGELLSTRIFCAYLQSRVLILNG